MKKIKKLLSVLLAVIICTLSFSLISLAFEESDLTYEVLPDETAVIISCKPTATGTVVVNPIVNIGGVNYPVVNVADYAFEGCKNITAIKFSEGIESIGAYAFKDCTGLKDIYFPESLASCKTNAFDSCGNMTLHCYSSSYSSIFVYALTPNLSIDIIDSDDGDIFGTGNDANLTNGIIDLIKRIILSILRLFIPSMA